MIIARSIQFTSNMSLKILSFLQTASIMSHPTRSVPGKANLFRGRQTFTAFALMFAIGLLGLPPQGWAEFPLNGVQSGTFAKGEYLVDSLLVVQSGSAVTFLAGATIRFKPFARMEVGGNLTCSGTRTNPVVFTSTNDRPGVTGRSAAPFDWSGITILESSDTVHLSQVHLSFSSIGISIRSTRTRVVIDSLYASGNGTADITRGSESITATGGIPLVWASFDRDPTPSPVDLATAPLPPPPPPPRWTAPALIVSAGLAIAGGFMYGIGEYEARKNKRAYEDTTATNTTAKTNELESRDSNLAVVRAIGIGLGATGVVGVTVTVPLRLRKGNHAQK